MSSQTTPATAASQLAESAVVADAVRALVDELTAVQSTLTGARPPQVELVSGYQSALDRLAELRGRASLYPYLGSGVGHGPLVELADGSVKWDLINGIGVHMFGHGDPDLAATAIRAALSDTVMQGNLQCNEDVLEFAGLLVEQASRTSKIAHAFVTNSGAMANESALKVCMQHKDGKASRVIAFADCFMGRSTTMAQIGDNPAGRVGLPQNTLVDYMPFYDPEHGDRSTHYAVQHLEDCIRRYPDRHACFVMELVQGEGGFNIGPREFFVPLMETAKAHDIPVWIDEVQTFGRTPSMFYFEQLDLGALVDVVTVGKMSQVCGCLYTEALNPKPGLLSGTFIGSTVALQVGRRLLERLRDGGYYGQGGRIEQLFDAFTTRAQRLVDEHPKWFPPVPHACGGSRTASGLHGGVGGMMRLTPFSGDRKQIVALLHKLFELGVIAFYCGHGPYHLRFLPPVGVMTPGHFDQVFRILEAAMAEVAGE